MESKDEFAKQIGDKIKKLRKEAGLTLKQLAKATELSAPLISKIENGVTMPSVPTLRVIADSLKVDIGYLFKSGEKKGYSISRQGSRRISYAKRSQGAKALFEVEFLTKDMKDVFFEPIIISWLLRKNEGLKEITHGGQEFHYVLEGRLELTFEGKKFVLNKGDAAYFDANIPHKGASLSKKPARTLMVHMVPGTREGTFETINQYRVPQ